MSEVAETSGVQSGQIVRLARHSLVYGGGNYLAKFLGFFLIPVYTRYIPPHDYGLLALVGILSSLLFIVLNMGQSSSLFRSYFDYETRAEREVMVWTCVLLSLLFVIPTSIMVVGFAGSLSGLLLGAERYKGLILLGLGATAARALVRIPFAVMRAEERSGRYASLNVAKGLSQIGLALLLVVAFGQGIAGILWSQVAAEGLFCIGLLALLLWGTQRGFSRPAARSLLSFGAPLVPAGVATFVLNLSDRYFLKHFASISDVGLYSLGYRFGEILWMMVWAVELGFPRFLYANEQRPGASRLYARALTYYWAVFLFATLALGLCARELVVLMAAPAYREAYRVVPIIALSQVFHGFVFIGAVGVALKRRTIHQAYFAGVAAVLNLGLNYLWIPTYGMMGAAAATAVSFLVNAIGVTAVSHRLYPLPWEWGRLARVMLAAAGLYAAGTMMSQGLSVAAALAVKGAAILAFPVALYATGFFTADEVAQLRALRRRLLQFGRTRVSQAHLGPGGGGA